MAEAPVVDDFDAAFTEAASAAEKQVQEAVVPKEEPKQEVVKEQPKDEQKQEVIEPVKKDEQKQEVIKETPKDEPKEPTAEEIAAKGVADKKAADDALAKEESDKKIRAEAELRVQAEATAKQRIAAEEADKKQKEEAAAKAKKEVEVILAPYEMTDAEKSADAKFKENFPEEYAATQTMINKMRKELEAQVYKANESVVKQINGDVASLKQSAADRSAEEHAKAIRTAHSDFDNVIVKFPEWVKQQPVHLQSAYATIYDAGSTEQVISMVADMKKSLGLVPKDAPVVKTVVTPPKADVDALTPVNSSRVTPNQKGAPDQNDYDGAFAEAAAKA